MAKHHFSFTPPLHFPLCLLYPDNNDNDDDDDEDADADDDDGFGS